MLCLHNINAYHTNIWRYFTLHSDSSFGFSFIFKGLQRKEIEACQKYVQGTKKFLPRLSTNHFLVDIHSSSNQIAHRL